MTVSSPAVARSSVRARRVAAAPSASPTGRACVRSVPIENGVQPRDAAQLRPHDQTTALLKPRSSPHAHAR
jgi:hypothetical protein